MVGNLFLLTNFFLRLASLLALTGFIKLGPVPGRLSKEANKSMFEFSLGW